MFILVLSNLLVLIGLALLSALVLYFTSKKFLVIENPKIAEIESHLPGANCGACGKAGCHDFAKACAQSDADTFKNLYCSVGGQSAMSKIADILGFVTTNKNPTVAVLRCNGTCKNAPDKVQYTGMKSCRVASRITVGQSGCPDGCLRFGDCVKACQFGALHIDESTGLPVVDASKCVSCGACVNMCPRGLFEIRPLGENGSMVYVACRNHQKGAIARKNCTAACIGCMKCTKTCNQVKVENNLSYIPTDVNAQQFGADLAQSCPTQAIKYIEGKND